MIFSVSGRTREQSRLYAELLFVEVFNSGKQQVHLKLTLFIWSFQSLVELENSRDDLLFELHKLTNPYSTVDRDLLKEYFAPVTELSIQMEKQVTNLA